jgi:hypothetical protein
MKALESLCPAAILLWIQQPLLILHASCASMRLGGRKHTIQPLADPCPALLDLPPCTQVSSAGDVVYSFNRGFASALRARSLLLSARPVFKTLRKVGAWVTRALFGTTLIASIAAVWLAVSLCRGCCIPRILSWSMAAIMVPIESHHQPAPFWNGVQECYTSSL